MIKKLIATMMATELWAHCTVAYQVSKVIQIMEQLVQRPRENINVLPTCNCRFQRLKAMKKKQ